jgi:hypothetical protein
MASDMNQNIVVVGNRASATVGLEATKADAGSTWVNPCTTVTEHPIAITQSNISTGNDGTGTTTAS